MIAGCQLAIHLVTNAAYGFHTDELYYIAAGEHPALGYVDFPPITPLLALVNITLFGISPWTLRLFPAITSAVMVFLTGLCARELGGDRRTQILASIVALLSLYLLATWLFQTVEFDEVTWLLAIYLLLRILRTRDPRLFVVLGIDLGLGLETKFTIIGLCVGLAAAVLLSRSLIGHLRTPYPWIGLAAATALALPNAIWQVRNGFPSLIYTANHSGDIAHSGGAVAFVALFVLLIGPLWLPLFAAGLWLLLRDRSLRPAGIAAVVAILVFLPNGKAYYPGPVVPLVLAAGCVAIGRLSSAARKRWTARLVIAAGVVEVALTAPVVLPLVPPASMHRLGIDRVNSDFANTVGWPDLAEQVGAVYNALPPEQRNNAAIVAAIDGQAAAINIYGEGDHLPAALSPQLSSWYWKPPDANPTTLVTVGYSPTDLDFLCGSIRQARTVTIPYGVDNLSQGSPILVCTDLRESLTTAWRRLKNFS